MAQSNKCLLQALSHPLLQHPGTCRRFPGASLIKILDRRFIPGIAFPWRTQFVSSLRVIHRPRMRQLSLGYIARLHNLRIAQGRGITTNGMTIYAYNQNKLIRKVGYLCVSTGDTLASLLRIDC